MYHTKEGKRARGAGARARGRVGGWARGVGAGRSTLGPHCRTDSGRPGRGGSCGFPAASLRMGCAEHGVTLGHPTIRRVAYGFPNPALSLCAFPAAPRAPTNRSSPFSTMQVSDRPPLLPPPSSTPSSLPPFVLACASHRTERSSNSRSTSWTRTKAYVAGSHKKSAWPQVLRNC